MTTKTPENNDVKRFLNLDAALKKKSHFLLGPRQTGKSYLIRQSLPHARIYDLLLKETFRALSHNPGLIREELESESGKSEKIIVIDEIQKLPELLDEVQWLIENKRVRFLLTGSSARKLKRYGTNLLGGRARLLRLHPFVRSELGKQFDLMRAAQVGLIPSIYFSDDPEQDLDAYVALYIQQEIANEGLTRNLPAFSRVLEVAALCQAEQTDFTAVSNDAQVPRTTVHEYFQILEDTLMIHRLEPWGELKSRKPVATSKYYFFDWGVARKLQNLGRVAAKSPLFGKAFESIMFHELRSYCDYHTNSSLHYWRTQSNTEVDFILNGEIAIEVKGKEQISANDLKSLQILVESGKTKRHLLVYLGPRRKIAGFPAITLLPYGEFLDLLWSGELTN
jgi:predicted AAA+ superfamily ATPase